MASRFFAWVILSLGMCSMPAAQAQAMGEVDAWVADARANKQAQKEAEKAAGQAYPPRGNGKDDAVHRPPPREGGPGESGGSTPPSGGPDGGMEGHGGGKGGPGGPPGGGSSLGGRQASAADMLRPEMAFAAPVKGELVMYRTREAVLFGREDGEPVILPLSGEPVAIAPGVIATVHEGDGALVVDMATSNGIRVAFAYRAGSDGMLTVEVHAEGPLPHPGSRFDVVRRYAAGPHRKS